MLPRGICSGKTTKKGDALGIPYLCSISISVEVQKRWDTPVRARNLSPTQGRFNLSARSFLGHSQVADRYDRSVQEFRYRLIRTKYLPLPIPIPAAKTPAQLFSLAPGSQARLLPGVSRPKLAVWGSFAWERRRTGPSGHSAGPPSLLPFRSVGAKSITYHIISSALDQPGTSSIFPSLLILLRLITPILRSYLSLFFSSSCLHDDLSLYVS